MTHKLNKILVQYSFAVILFLKLRFIFSVVDDFIRKLLKVKPNLYLLEYHVADHCNLNCKGCFHFSNIVGTRDFPSFELYSRDIKKLKELFGNINTIRLMGGEPLLNPQLVLFINETRKVFPRANIHILSNGLLYKKLEGELLEAVKSCGVEIHVSLYKPMLDKKENAKRYFQVNSIKYSMSNPILQFAKYINVSGSSGPKESVKQCPASRCVFLSNGHIARCPLPFNIKHFNKFFGQLLYMEHEHINIHDQNLDGFVLKQKLRKPMESCRFCGKLEWFDWELDSPDKSRIKMSDFCRSE